MWNFLGAIASLLPGYMQGRRQAIQDNWTDLSNYNQVQAGQLANAFTEGTWDYNMARARDAATNSGFQTWNNMRNLQVNEAYFPKMLTEGQIASWYAPYTAQYDQQNKLLAQMLIQRNPMLGFGWQQNGNLFGGNAQNPVPSIFNNGVQ